MVKKIAFIGAGAFGYALAVMLARTHPEKDFYAYDISEEYVNSLKKNKKHPVFFTDIKYPGNVYPTLEPGEAFKDAEVIVAAVPAQAMRKAVAAVKDMIPAGAIILNVSKALEKGSNKRMSEVIREELGNDNPIAALSGGMIAPDVIHGMPVGAEIACPDEEALEKLKEIFVSSTVHVDLTTDIIGIELSGALKNAISIGSGICDGLELGYSSKAFFISKSLMEMEKLSVKLGADPKTFHTGSNAWMGDLMASCFGGTRNRLFGEMIGRGTEPKAALNEMHDNNMHAEGYATLEVVNGLLDKHNIDAPFLRMLYNVVYKGKDPKIFYEMSLFQNS